MVMNSINDIPARTRRLKLSPCALFTLFSAALFLTPVQRASGVDRIAEAPVRDTVFENGLTVLAMEDKSNPLVALLVTYHVGSRDEVEGKTGLAQVAGRMLTTGSLGYRKEEYGRLVHSGGGDFGFEIVHDNSMYWSRFPKHLLRKVLLMEADRMENPNLSRENLEGAKSSARRVRDAYLETNIYAPLVLELLSRVYPDHPYGRLEYGSEEDISALSVSDARSWMGKFFLPANATITLVGDFKRGKLFEELLEIFADIPSAPAPLRVLPQLSDQTAERRSHIVGSIQIPVLIAGYEVPELAHQDRLALDLLAGILYGERSSRIYQRLVVSSGKCLFAGGDIVEFTGPGLLYFFAFMNQGEALSDAEALLNEEFKRVIDGDLSEGDLIIARKQLEAEIYQQGARALPRAKQISRSYETWGESMRWWDDLERLESVTLSDIARVAREYLKEEKRTIILMNPAGAKPSEVRP